MVQKLKHVEKSYVFLAREVELRFELWHAEAQNHPEVYVLLYQGVEL